MLGWLAFAAAHGAINLWRDDATAIMAVMTAVRVVLPAALLGLVALGVIRFIIRRAGGYAFAATAHGAAALAYGAVWILIVWATNLVQFYLTSPDFRFFVPGEGIATWHLVTGALIYAALASFEYAAHEWKQRMETARRADIAVSVAKFDPHFLFNALHCVRGLVATNPHQAEDAIDRLAELFRRNLAQADHEAELIPIRDELDYCEDYLALQKLRFGARLKWRIEIARDGAAIRLPARTLQPIVENAIKHGVEATDGAVAIEIIVNRRQSAAQISICNTAPEDGERPQRSFGEGLAFVRRRLDAAFADDYALAMETKGGWFEVRLRFPAAPIQLKDD
ncbi:MAG: hypothetical protein Tsb0010_01150 [Parvularculaceae bacterium]